MAVCPLNFMHNLSTKHVWKVVVWWNNVTSLYSDFMFSCNIFYLKMLNSYLWTCWSKCHKCQLRFIFCICFFYMLFALECCNHGWWLYDPFESDKVICQSIDVLSSRASWPVHKVQSLWCQNVQQQGVKKKKKESAQDQVIMRNLSCYNKTYFLSSQDIIMFYWHFLIIKKYQLML